MKAVNVAEFRSHFGKYLRDVERGGVVQICKRNRGVATVTGVSRTPEQNATRLGSARGTVRILGDITAPAFSDEEWEMHR